MPSGGSVQSDRFDYAENVETTSSMSTPTSGPGAHWGDNPFAQDSLGDTVIHLDQVRWDEGTVHLLVLTDCLSGVINCWQWTKI